LEAGLVAAAGALFGVLLGIGYAWLMVTALRTWWVGAISTPFLRVYVGPLSLLIGFVAGLFVSILTIWFSLGRTKRAVVRSLLAGEMVARTEYSVQNKQFAVSTRKGSGPATFRTLHSALSILAALLFFAAVALAFYAS